MVNPGINDKRWQIPVAAIRRVQLASGTQRATQQFDAVPACRSEPAAVEVFRLNADGGTFAINPSDVFLDIFLCKTTHNAGRYQDYNSQYY